MAIFLNNIIMRNNEERFIELCKLVALNRPTDAKEDGPII